MSPFRLKIFSLISEIKQIWIRFTCISLFHYNISLLFFSFFSLIFASNFSLRFTWVLSASKRKKLKQNSSLFFRFFHFFLYFLLFSFFFAWNFSLRFDLVIFAMKRNKAKRNSSLLIRFFAFFHFFSLFFAFFTFFRLIFVSHRFFHLIFTKFTFVFASDLWYFASKWIMWNQAFFCFEAKQNFHFNFKFRFRSEIEGAPYRTLCMRQRTKNHRNQGSIDKKIRFFSKSLRHMSRWVRFVQKTRSKNSHAWAPLRDHIPTHCRWSL